MAMGLDRGARDLAPLVIRDTHDAEISPFTVAGLAGPLASVAVAKLEAFYAGPWRAADLGCFSWRWPLFKNYCSVSNARWGSCCPVLICSLISPDANLIVLTR